MTRSRLVVFSSVLVVGGGLLAAVFAFFLDPARAAVGPLPAEALVLPSDARFVGGFDVKRFTASPFYQRYATGRGAARPDAFKDLELRMGLDPERDLDQVVIAGRGGMGEAGVALVLGRFDRSKLARVIETQKRGATWKQVEGTTVYLFSEGLRGASALAFLDDHTVVLGTQQAVEATVANGVKRGPSLRSNAALMALLGRVRPGSTFWMVGDQSLLANLPQSIPAPGPGGSSQSLTLPGLKSLIVTGELDPLVALEITGETSDEAAARNLADVVRGFVALASLQASQKPELKELTSAISVTTEASLVRVNARVPYELLDSLQPRSDRTAPAPWK